MSQTHINGASGDLKSPIWTIEGLPHYSYGHSFGVIQGTPNASPNSTYFKRISARHFASTYTNQNVNSYRWIDTARKIASTWTTGNKGLVIMDSTINDIGFNHSSTLGPTGFVDGLRASLWLLRAGSRVEETAATGVTGTWSSSSNSVFSGGTLTYNGVQGSSYTLSYTGSRAALLTYGMISSLSGLGGVMSMTVDGVDKGTTDLGNRFLAGASTTNGTSNFAPLVVPITNVAYGTHAVTVTKVDATTNVIYCDAVLVESTTPPTIVIVKGVTCTSDGYARYSAPYATDADVLTYNGYIDNVVNEFPNDGTIITVDPLSEGWNATTMTAADGQHPNDRGMAFITNCVERALRKVSFRNGLNVGIV